MPQISVIVPIYNVEPYLRRCVDSILSQTYTDFELILIDDESPDACPGICDEYANKDKRVKVIHKKNGGVSAARNSGLNVAQGEYIAFCDSDDWWDCDFLQRHIEVAQTENSDIVISNYRVVNDENEILRTSHNAVISTELLSAEQRFQHVVQYTLGAKCGWEVWVRIFRRKLIADNLIRFPTDCKNYAEDLGFTVSTSFYVRQMDCIDYCGYNYYQRAGSMMRKSQNTVKLNQLNEVSKEIYKNFCRAFSANDLIRYYPIIHFLVMEKEYQKVVLGPEYSTLPQHIVQISDQKFYRRMTRRIFRCYSHMKTLFGKRISRQICLISHFCIHRNWKLFQLESAVSYRFFIKGE